jgi:hypothetical protein
MDIAPQPMHQMMSPPPVHEPRMIDMLDPQLMRSPQDARSQMDAMPSQQANLLGGPPLDPSWGYDLNLLSHAASHVASTGQTPLEGISHMPQVSHEPMQPMPPSTMETQYQPRMLTEGYGNPRPMFEAPDLGDPMQDFTVFLDSVGLSSDWHSGIFNSVESDPFASPSMRYTDHLAVPRTQLNGEPISTPRSIAGQEESNSFSRFGSRLPSLQPESRDPDGNRGEGRNIEDSASSKARAVWEVSDGDRQAFMTKLENFSAVLPKGFNAPSRHSLSRYLAGYINGFHEHLPFIHVPTLSVSASAPELVLALAAVGAQYRFENSRGMELFYAAKSVVMEQIRRRDAYWAPPMSWNRPSSIAPSPSGGFPSLEPTSSPFPYMSGGETSAPDELGQMGSIQALLLLTAFATWEKNRELLREALAFQSILARLVREAGLTSPDLHLSAEDLAWEDWIKLEGDKRTKLIVFCFFNLHSITWNVPPLIMNAEVKLNLPEPADEWKATNAAQWKKLHQANATPPMPFQTTFNKLFSGAPASPNNPVSPLGNYVLIHAMIQQIFFARQLSRSWPGIIGTSLRPEDLSAFERGLAAWKAGWRRAPESSLDPQNPNGPVAFTSTALLGLAYIRLHVDMGPLRHLETRDPMQVALALRDSPAIRRSPRLTMALLHSAHALSIPVRLGIDFVAKTQTFFWSIQHSLCSLECAFLLSKWLAAVSSASSNTDPPLSEHEQKLLVWVRSMLDETEMAVAIDGNANGHANMNDSREIVDDSVKVRRLSVAVVRVWAKTFKGNTSWAIVDLIGSALELYADMLEKDIS